MTTAQLSQHHPTVASQSPLTPAVAKCIDSTFKDRWRCLQSVDDLIAAVVDTVDKAGALGNTYFLYSSDHGYQLGELNLPQDKRNVYEFDVKIHLLVRGPGIRAGSQWSEVASNVDFAPTILAMAGLAAPDSMDGRSFLRLVVDADSAELPATVRKSLERDAARGDPWRTTHYIKHNSVGAGNYPSPKPPNCAARPHGAARASDHHFVDQVSAAAPFASSSAKSQRRGCTAGQ